MRQQQDRETPSHYRAIPGKALRLRAVEPLPARTLIVTTDPASNLSDTFEQEIGHQVTPISIVPNLWTMEIDPYKATQEYIDHAMAPIHAAFPAQLLQVMEEQMNSLLDGFQPGVIYFCRKSIKVAAYATEYPHILIS